MLGLKFRTIGSGVAETGDAGHPIKTVRQNSESKSREVASGKKGPIIIGADTIVVLGKSILNKPEDQKMAAEFLRRLSGNKHTVYTGVNVINTKNGKESFGYEKTTVKFRDLTEDEISHYVKNHKPLDKAGAYGIQDDFGCLFIRSIKGDYYNIVGLPLVRLYECIKNVI